MVIGKDNLVARRIKFLHKRLFDLGLPYLNIWNWYVFPDGKRIARSEVVDLDVVIDIGSRIGKRSLEAGITAKNYLKILDAIKIMKDESKFIIKDFYDYDYRDTDE